jgi:hypothetical protein
VAVLVGYFLGGEALGARTVLGTFLVLISVVVITTTPKKKAESELSIKPADSTYGRPVNRHEHSQRNYVSLRCGNVRRRLM